jgi:3-oxoacyl-[acyl-carrier protein] reductase
MAAGRRVVVVTGGARGLGLACADTFAEAGDLVVVTWRSQPPPRHLAVRCDITDADQVEAAFDEIEEREGHIDVLVANAGALTFGFTARQSQDSLREATETNLVGAALTARRAARSMSRRKQGAIVFISSAAARRGPEGLSAYAASKGAIEGYARTLARELGRRNVTVNVVAPGLLENLAEVVPGASSWIEQTPLGRAGTFEEVAAVVQHVASPAARFMTGAVIPVDGGLAMGVG